MVLFQDNILIPSFLYVIIMYIVERSYMRVTYGSYRVLKNSLACKFFGSGPFVAILSQRGLSTENRVVLLIYLDNSMDKVF